jgi:L-gulono-1,4-lactone dehydrogenase
MRAGGATWRNWAGNQECAPAAVEHPTTEADLSRVVKSAAAAGRTVKVIGAGHSFTDIACTNGTQVVLDRYKRVIQVDREAATVTVQSGISLGELNGYLAKAGLALPNLGDIAYQSVAGAISTSTHGTGVGLGGLATQVKSLELMTADGELVSCSADEEAQIFSAARVGLGALGILATVTLQCVPAFRVNAVERAMPVDRVLDKLEEYVDGNEHFEFFWVPHTPFVITKRNNRTDEPLRPLGRWHQFKSKILFENVAFDIANRIGRLRPSLIPKLATAVPGSGKLDYVDDSYKIFASPRWVRFYEMEYSVPRASAVDVINRLRAFVDDSGLKIGFPVEVRFTAPDDIWLSTANGTEERCYVAVHVYKGMPYEQYFRGVEAIMDSVGGRPHWGKLHFQTAETLRPKYPHFDDFVAVRNRLDPERRFTNAYLDRVLGS